MEIEIYQSKEELGAGAAGAAAGFIREAIEQRGEAFIILATGVSQYEMLENLVEADLDWARVTAFHLDEYIDLPITHPASFRKYLMERFENRVPSLRKFHYVNGENPDPEEECKRLGGLIGKVDIDVACLGIGENGHLAFNDPPADFEMEAAYLVVDLDERCRRQQWGEGWFPSLESVPKRAISMSIKQILKSRAIVCCAPDKRKAEAVQNALEGEISPANPASILRRHPQCRFFLDEDSTSLLTQCFDKSSD